MSKAMSKAMLTLRQKFLSNGSSCIPEFLFEERFNFSSKKKHEITNLCETLTCFSSPVEKKKKNRYKYIIPREARRGAPSREVYNLVAREARVYHTNIARPAWFPLGYKSIKFGWCPPWRHPVSDVRAHYGFPGNRLPSTTKLWVLFMKTVFFHLWIITMFTLGKSPNISSKTKENSKLNNGGFNKWLEILAGKDFNTNKTPQERGRRL